MTKDQQHRKQIRTLETAIGVQLAEYGGLEKLPVSTRKQLEQRVTALGLKFPDDFELPENK